MYYIYILVSEKGKTYIGYSSNLDRRLKEHNEGKSKSTRGQKWKLVYYEAFRDELDARERERKLKQRGGTKQSLMKRIARSRKIDEK